MIKPPSTYQVPQKADGIAATPQPSVSCQQLTCWRRAHLLYSAGPRRRLDIVGRSDNDDVLLEVLGQMRATVACDEYEAVWIE